MKKTISRILVLTLCLGLLAGCSDKNPTAGTDPEYVPIPELTDPPETTEAPRRFDIDVADPIPVPVVATEKDITPDEFRDILLALLMVFGMLPLDAFHVHVHATENHSVDNEDTNLEIDYSRPPYKGRW